ncbi:rho GDP-dissociation inhibitor 1-like [Anneissia japonica]|uniref:rho GDP-dissociation inhibitor 1-like n=1 Tax=Anneissia japonica TaxID=1529436 RepID=UPI0014258A14|nr:rho GDP-dissociation inhibitor 1-like [Anneissia japonica]
MAEVPAQDAGHVSSDEEEVTPGYKAPAKATLEEIAQKDQDDESLQKYKKALLGGDVTDIVTKDGPNVVVEKMALLSEHKVVKEVDLTGDLSKIKDTPFVIKEGAEFQIQVTFRVNREIVSGLRYSQGTYRKGIRVDKSSFMVGSYGPKNEAHKYVTAIDEAPKGLIARGHYTVKSKFTDDDRISHLEWEWTFDVKKDWE